MRRNADARAVVGYLDAVAKVKTGVTEKIPLQMGDGR
jgi:hypothetical protein